MEYLWWLLPCAFLLDLILGDPDYPFHPIRLIGNYVIVPVEQFLRKRQIPKKAAGFLLFFATIMTTTMTVYSLNWILSGFHILVLIFNLYIVYSCIALKDLWAHVAAVLEALDQNCIEKARTKLQLIVGRETAKLTEPEIYKALIETMAENFSDGFIAPVFYTVVGGALGVIFYKSVNTLDSMVGYKNEKYLELGFCSAKMDDLLNWIPARLTFIIIICVSTVFLRVTKKTWKLACTNAGNHTSPNAGFPEAAMAVVLNIKLGGPNTYAGQLFDKPFINPAGLIPQARDVQKTWTIVLIGGILAVLGGSICSFIISF